MITVTDDACHLCNLKVLGGARVGDEPHWHHRGTHSTGRTRRQFNLIISKEQAINYQQNERTLMTRKDSDMDRGKIIRGRLSPIKISVSDGHQCSDGHCD
jgi:hypothetical protein